MRAREILEEDYSQNLETDLTNLLVSEKATGAREVRTQDIVDQLYAMGYYVDVNGLISLLSRNPVVLNATPEMINLTQSEVFQQGPGDSSQDSAARVKDMASKATSIG